MEGIFWQVQDSAHGGVEMANGGPHKVILDP